MQRPPRRSPWAATLLLGAVLSAPFAALAAEPSYDAPYGSTPRLMVEDAARVGWEKVALAVQDRTLEDFEAGHSSAEDWFRLAQAASWFAQPQRRATERWLEAVEQARAAHANMPREYALVDAPLADLLSPRLQEFLLEEQGLLVEFFTLMDPLDNSVEVARILDALYREFPTRFRRYGSLALAIAVVYDVPPPPGWPHFQVPNTVLPRRLHDPVDAFSYFTSLDRQRLSAHDLDRLPAEILKFVVDTPAPFRELDWARAKVRSDVDDFAVVYDSVAYRNDRIRTGTYIWGGSSYTLAAIQETGGICVDQAYFAAQAGKAHGIPTLIFRGAGLDGRHAWFGFLHSNGEWDFDAGRYGDNLFVTGLAHDPQTWRDISDHELAFLAEGFRRSGRYQRSYLQSQLAGVLAQTGKVEVAGQLAENAVGLERRNRLAWEVLLSLAANEDDGGRAEEDTLRRAAQAFRAYPDLETLYRERLTRLYASRGQDTLASRERRQLAVKNSDDRIDLAIRQSAAELAATVQDKSPTEQMRTYRVILLRQGQAGGALLFDQVVIPFVQVLLNRGDAEEAVRAAHLADEHIARPAGSQLDQELRALVANTEAARRS